MTLEIILRIVLAYFILWLGIKILGKKEMGKLTYHNLATAAAMGSLAANLGVNNNIPIIVATSALVSFFGLSYLLGYLSLKSYSARKIFEGKPTVVVSKGSILEENLEKMRLSTDNLLEKLREHKAFSVADVEFAVMETDGKMSVLLKAENQPVTPKTMNLSTTYKGLPTDIIKDGCFIEENLIHLGITKEQVEERLIVNNIKDVSEVVLAQVDATGQLYMDLKKDN